MKYLLVLCYIVAAAVAEDKYTTKYDHINVQEVLSNDRLLAAYFDCIMDRGKCTGEGAELKTHIVDAMETGCAKCSKHQETEATKAIKYLIEFHPEKWQELTGKYDSNGKWRKHYEERAKEAGIVLP